MKIEKLTIVEGKKDLEIKEAGRVTVWCDVADRKYVQSWFKWLVDTGIKCAVVERTDKSQAVYREPWQRTPCARIV